jgi:hypothetical protein
MWEVFLPNFFGPRPRYDAHFVCDRRFTFTDKPRLHFNWHLPHVAHSAGSLSSLLN